eukprot:1290833-Amphidinium_carterae.1
MQDLKTPNGVRSIMIECSDAKLARVVESMGDTFTSEAFAADLELRSTASSGLRQQEDAQLAAILFQLWVASAGDLLLLS